MIYHINRLNTQKDTDTSSQFDRSVKVIQEIEDSFEWNSSGKIGYLYGEKMTSTHISYLIVSELKTVS